MKAPSFSDTRRCSSVVTDRMAVMSSKHGCLARCVRPQRLVPHAFVDWVDDVRLRRSGITEGSQGDRHAGLADSQLTVEVLDGGLDLVTCRTVAELEAVFLMAEPVPRLARPVTCNSLLEVTSLAAGSSVSGTGVRTTRSWSSRVDDEREGVRYDEEARGSASWLNACHPWRRHRQRVVEAMQGW